MGNLISREMLEFLVMISNFFIALCMGFYTLDCFLAFKYLEGTLTKEEMIKQAILSTRHYAKRQITWFKHQIKSDIELQNSSDFNSIS